MKKRTAKAWSKLVREGEADCDTAVEEHLNENYHGPNAIPSIPDVHLALCYSNMGWGNRVLELRNGPMTVAQTIQIFRLESFLPLFDQQDEAAFQKGEVVRYGNECWGCLCRVLGRREVTPFAMFRTDDWEVFLEALDGSNFGFVAESEIERLEESERRTEGE